MVQAQREKVGHPNSGARALSASHTAGQRACKGSLRTILKPLRSTSPLSPHHNVAAVARKFHSEAAMAAKVDDAAVEVVCQCLGVSQAGIKV